jgi:AraC-like DNA-binding protein/mannose-6-phosphate isomerase-like protein (cupin superfamily)
MAQRALNRKASEIRRAEKPFAYDLMKRKPDALERLEFQFRWGAYGVRVLKFHLTHFPPSRVIGFHKHSEFEFHFIPGGKGKVILGDREFSLRPGMFYLTGPEVLHQQEADSEEGMDELCLHVDIVQLGERHPRDENEWGTEWEWREAEECVKQLKKLPLVPAEDEYAAMKWFLTAYRAWYENQPGFYTTIKQSIIQILLRSMRAYGAKPAEFALPTRDMKAHRFHLALQFIQDNYASPITLEEVAEKVNVSGRQLQRIFREQSLGSFSEYLERTRLSKVCAQLLHSEKTVEQIAAEHGFTNSNYLYYVFKKRFHLTPSQYRQQNQP